jgi:hypothetical protein
MSHRSSAAAGLTATALALTGALPSLAAGQDLRSPDARDAAALAAPAQHVVLLTSRYTNPAAVTVQDLRSPDARDAATATPVPIDLQSPDARDVTRPRTVEPLRIVTVANDRFDWNDAVIGAGGALGLALLLGGGAATIARRRASGRVAV